MIRSSVFALLSVCFLSSWSPCSAVDVVLADNLGGGIFGSSAITTNFSHAQQFQTQSSAYILNKIQLPLYRQSTNSSGNYTISIYTNNSGVPGTLVSGAQLTAPVGTLGTSSAVQTFNISWTLNPNTYYFLVMSGTGITNESVLWNTSVGGGTGFPSSYTVSVNGGTTWMPPSEFPQQMMRITAVPEPSTYILSLVTVGVFAGVAKHKRRRSAKIQGEV